MAKQREPTKVPEPRLPRRRASATSRVVVWTFLTFLLVAAGFGAISFYVFQEYTIAGPLPDKRIFVVEQGLGTPEIALALENEGIISNASIFSSMAYVTGTRGRLKAGEYEFGAQSSMQDVMALIASGKSITYKLSVPEGFTSQMAVERVNANEILLGDPAAVPPEGSIMPDTFVFRRGATRQQLVQDMQAAQTKLLQDLWDKRVPVPVIETKEQAVILASIVEKETGVAAERPIIASVFVNRLKKGMRLQSDPTIIYGIAGGKGKLNRRLTRNDIETETPYNTYRINGLPPGPIANPGRAALEAVLNPPSTEYLYFVADGSGGHAFATTLAEHNRNVTAWRQISGDAAEIAAAETSPEATVADSAAPGSLPEASPPPATLDSPAQPEIPAPAEPAAPAVVPETVPATPEATAPATPAPATPPPAPATPVAETPAAPAVETPAAPAIEAPAAPAVEAPAAPAVETPAAPAVETPAAPAVEAPAAPAVETPAAPAVEAPVAKPPVAKPPVAKPPKPGSIFKIGGRQTAIPKPNPKR